MNFNSNKLSDRGPTSNNPSHGADKHSALNAGDKDANSRIDGSEVMDVDNSEINNDRATLGAANQLTVELQNLEQLRLPKHTS